MEITTRVRAVAVVVAGLLVSAGAGAQPQVTPFPAAAAGFRFGSSAQVAARACRAARMRWTQRTPTSASCSGPAAPIGFDVEQALLQFCGVGRRATLCGLFIKLGTDDVASTFAAINRALDGRYFPGRDSRTQGAARFWELSGGRVGVLRDGPTVIYQNAVAVAQAAAAEAAATDAAAGEAAAAEAAAAQNL